MSTDSFCLIGGSGRSGSTVLGRIFAGHPDLTDFPESRFLIDPDGLIQFYAAMETTWSPYIIDRRLKRLESVLRKCGKVKPIQSRFVSILRFLGIEQTTSRRLRPGYLGTEIERIIPDYSEMVDHFLGQITSFSYVGAWAGMGGFEQQEVKYCAPDQKAAVATAIAEFYKEIFARRRVVAGGTICFEKNTFCILFFDHIREIFPEARLVHIYRDPRDVVSSYVKQTWSPKNIHDAALWYKGIIARWNMVKARVPDESFIEVGLEALVANPEAELHKICTFWGIDWSDLLLNVPLERSNTGRWKTECSASEQRLLQELLAPELAQYCYE